LRKRLLEFAQNRLAAQLGQQGLAVAIAGPTLHVDAPVTL